MREIVQSRFNSWNHDGNLENRWVQTLPPRSASAQNIALSFPPRTHYWDVSQKTRTAICQRNHKSKIPTKSSKTPNVPHGILGAELARAVCPRIGGLTKRSCAPHDMLSLPLDPSPKVASSLGQAGSQYDCYVRTCAAYISKSEGRPRAKMQRLTSSSSVSFSASQTPGSRQ